MRKCISKGSCVLKRENETFLKKQWKQTIASYLTSFLPEINPVLEFQIFIVVTRRPLYSLQTTVCFSPLTLIAYQRCYLSLMTFLSRGHLKRPKNSFQSWWSSTSACTVVAKNLLMSLLKRLFFHWSRYWFKFLILPKLGELFTLGCLSVRSIRLNRCMLHKGNFNNNNNYNRITFPVTQSATNMDPARRKVSWGPFLWHESLYD